MFTIKTKVRKFIILIVFIILFLYLAISYSIYFNEKSDRELEQASSHVGEYLDIVGEFSTYISVLGEQYFSLEEIAIQDKFSDLEFSEYGTFDSGTEVSKKNRRLFGKGDYQSIKENIIYYDIVYVFDSFFEDFCEAFGGAISVTYYSKHDYIYVYSKNGSAYLDALEYNTQKYIYQQILEGMTVDSKVTWQEGHDYINDNEKIILITSPVIDDGEVEGIVSISYSLDEVNGILANNFYNTYIFDSEGVIVASSSEEIANDNKEVNLKDKELFGEKRGEEIVSTGFDFVAEGYYGLNEDYYKFSDLTCKDFVLFLYIPRFTYISSILVSLIVTIFIMKIAFLLNDAYEKRSEISLEYRNKYNELNALKSELEKAATIDFLTKLYNRRYMMQRITEEREKNKNGTFTLLMMDIDHFKSVNDTYGHKAGDAVLVNVSKSIVSSVRKTDLVARWGGEEMLVLLTNTKEGSSEIVCEKIRKKVEDTVSKVDDKKIKVTISIGVSEIKPESSFESVLMQADEALYNAKTTGRNKVVLYSEIENEKIEEENIDKDI